MMNINPVTKTVAVHLTLSSREALLEKEVEEIADREFRDLVFVCEGGQEVSCHSEVLSLVSPVVRTMVGRAVASPTSAFLRNKVQMFITLASVKAEVVEKLIVSLYEKTPLNISGDEVEEVGEVLKMMGVSENTFCVKKITSANEVKHDEIVTGNKRKRKVPQEKVVKRVKGDDLTDDEGSNAFDTIDEEESLPSMNNTLPTVNSSSIKKESANTFNVVTTSPIVKKTIAPMKNVPPNNNMKNIMGPTVKNTMGPAVVNTMMGPTVKNTMGPAEVNTMGPAVKNTMGPANRIPTTPTLPSLPPGLTMTSIKPVDNEEKENEPPVPTKTRVQSLLPGISVISVKQDKEDGLNAPRAKLTPEDMEMEEADLTNTEINNPDEREVAKPTEDPDTADINMDTDSDPTDLKCPLADCKTNKTFSMRFEILNHLSYNHYAAEISDLHPFVKGGPCSLCVNQGRTKVLSTSNKKAFLCHVGGTHEVVMDLLPVELKMVLQALPKGPKGGRGKKVSKKEMIKESEEEGSFVEESISLVAASEVEESTPLSPNPESFVSQNPDPRLSTTVMLDPPSPAPISGLSAPVPGVEDPSLSPTPVSGRSVPGVESPRLLPPTQASCLPSPTPAQSPSSSTPLSSLLSPGYTEETQVQARVEEGESRDVFSCHLCVERRFNKVDDLLFHLSVIHFSKDLLEVVPFKEGAECEICREEGGPECLVREKESMSTHLTHQGVEHRQVLAFLPPHLANNLRQMDEETEVSFRTYPAQEGMARGREVETSEPAVNVEEELEENKPSVSEKPAEIDVGKESEESSELKISEVIEATPNLIENKEPNLPEKIKSVVDVMSMNEETELSVENVKQSEKKVEETNKPVGVRCSLCPANKTREYCKRSDLLKHLALSHFGKQLLSAFPHVEGEPCNTCLATTGKSWSTPKREVHVCHVGVLHAKVFDFLSEAQIQVVKSMPTVKRGRPSVSRAEEKTYEEKVAEKGKTGQTVTSDAGMETLNEATANHEA